MRLFPLSIIENGTSGSDVHGPSCFIEEEKSQSSSSPTLGLI